MGFTSHAIFRQLDAEVMEKMPAESLVALLLAKRSRSGSQGLDVCYWPDPEAPTAGPTGPLTEVDLPCRRSEWHGSF